MTSTTSLTRLVAKLLFLPSIMVAAAILLKGYAETGDGFSAGVIVSLAVLMQCVAFGPEQLQTLPGAKHAAKGAFIGLAIALVIIFRPLLTGDPIMTHLPRAGEHATHFGALEFITPLVFDIGVFLVVFGFCTGVLGAVASAQKRVLEDRAMRDEAMRRRMLAQEQQS